MKSLMELADQRFSPFQPEIKYIMDNYVEYKPSHTSKNISLYYQFKAPANTIDSFSLIPDGCFDIVFYCYEGSYSAYLWASPTERSKEIELEQQCEYFGVRFRPEQNLIDFKSSMRELLDKQIPLIDIVSIDPKTIKEIAFAATFIDKIRIFKKHLVHFTTNAKEQTVLEYCINKIYLFKGVLNISELVTDTGFSDRYIRNLFEKYIGFSPKQFSEIVRFQNSLSMMLKESDSSMLEIIHENNFHDQAHFIKSFKKFVHLPPSQYRNSLLEIKNTDI